jgi:IS30 family transposase
MPGGKQHVRLRLRAEEIKRMRHSGIGVKEVAQAFGVCVRTVQREMKRIRRIKK